MVEIRKARLGEAEALRSLYVEAAEWIRETKGYNQWQEASFTEAYIEQFLRTRDVFVAELGGRVVGCFSVECEEELFWGERFHRDAGYVHRLVVSRKHQGLDIGGQMLAWAAGFIRSQGKSWLRLDCMADNPPLNRFYERQGLTFVGRVDVDVWRANLYEKRVNS
ncbi:GNAT family N-acetyltransferase [Paenibacillus rhizovicinus]|uniref:GNAT family N-acetyltransferase n=1 Tax=Paenibacillus rhizovicinus TaxID=2704463 RepID=A0A6C0P7V3_9BACL|nr:GNAT family N-acetyltransferase [Paenibacillus rhizovicinus]QHW34710.1 GNAT family N-acetyltransferase [Paenibacillus rhizovicinus]